MSFASALELEMLALVNAERAERGLSQLRLNTALNAASEDHSDWMLDTNTFSHTGINGSNAGERMADAGFVFSGSWSWAENVGWQSARGPAGFSDDVAQVHAALMNSPGHRANILNPNLEEIGIGVEIGTFTTQGNDWQAVMITQKFARTAADTSGQRDPGETGASPAPLPPAEDPQTPLDFTGTETADSIEGDDNDNLLQGLAGGDTLSGGLGADTLEGGAGNDLLNGGAGGDTLLGGSGADQINGNAGNDSLLGGEGFDVLRGGAGNDTIIDTGTTADRLYGGDGNDLLRAGSSNGMSIDGLFGEAGNDTLMGEAGFDMLDGGSGNDVLDGGNHADNLHGRAGEDVLIGGQGLDRLFGGDDNDTASGGDGNDGLFGEAGDDVLNGNAGDDRFFGGVGNDSLFGGTGEDTLNGNAGFDVLNGGAGDDLLYGRFNADRFVFDDGHGNDIVADFDALNVFEKIDLTGVSAISQLSDLNLGSASLGAATQEGLDVLIDTGGANAIRLTNVDLGDLDASDFIF